MPDLNEWRTHPTESKRCDWFSGSFVLPDDRRVDDMLGLAFELAVLSNPQTFPEPLRSGKHFSHVRQFKESGVLIQYSPHTGVAGELLEHRNTGRASLTLSGRFWGALDCADRAQVIDTLRCFPGFKHTTRLDLQITRLNPVVSATEFVAEVEAGRIWPKGFGQGYPYGRRNLHGDFVQVPSYMFGGIESRVQARCYDKADEADWDVPAVRHELVLKDAPADQWFRRLADRTKRDLAKGPLLHIQEELTVSAALDQHLDYRDTSRWAGGRKPKNWAQSAKRLEWWDEMLASKGDALKIEYRKENTLDETIEHMVQQYGRKFALWVISRAGLDGVMTTEVLIHTFIRCLALTKDSDIAELMEVLPEADRERAQLELRRLQREAIVIAERLAPPENAK